MFDARQPFMVLIFFQTEVEKVSKLESDLQNLRTEHQQLESEYG